MLAIHQFPCLNDNYGYLVHDPASGETVAIDTPDPEEYLAQAAARGWRITQIWNTHWHADHAGGNIAIKQAAQAWGGCTITAPLGDAARIEGIDRTVRGGDAVQIGAHQGQVLETGGHTLGHSAFHLAQSAVAFVGDALFALGCGRMFEGTPEQFWASLVRLRHLPPDTLIFCAHEYSQANARFARHADPDNADLAAYAQEIDHKRASGERTVPFALARELFTNPFLRADAPPLQARWGGAQPHETFAALRAAKDRF